MNILHLEASSGWGGQEIRILQESEGMRQRGHEITLVVEKGGLLAQKACKAGFTVYEIKFKKKFWIFSFFKLLWLIKKHKIDIVNTHSSLDAWLGGIASKFLKIPIIRTRHLSTDIRKGINSLILYGKLADIVVTTCQDMVLCISNIAKKSKEFCLSIPTGVDVKLISYEKKEAQEFRKKNNILATDCLVGFVCVMRSWKGIDDYLKTIYLLRDIADLKWVIIGGGHSEEYIYKAKKLNLEKKLIFTGHLENPFYAIDALDIFVLLSTASEGVSQAALQAAYLKKPLVTTPTGGLKEICIDQKTGFQVPIFSSDKVAEAILKLKDDEKLRSSFGENARKLVEEKFTQEIMLDKMERVYGKIGKR
jgi:glycosyltransferase involved in cell wall biosynthesis